jgi:hypothetical protein
MIKDKAIKPAHGTVIHILMNSVYRHSVTFIYICHIYRSLRHLITLSLNNLMHFRARQNLTFLFQIDLFESSIGVNQMNKKNTFQNLNKLIEVLSDD